jgi:N-acetylmuramoyl-L-alanine amidase
MHSSTFAKLPPENYRRIIQEMLVVLPDPVDKLNLLNRVLVDFGRIPSFYRLNPRRAEIALRKMVLDEAERIQPGSRKKAQQLMKQGAISIPSPCLWKIYRFRHIIVSTVVLLFIWVMGPSVATLFEIIQPQTMFEGTLVRPTHIQPSTQSSQAEKALNVAVKTGPASTIRKYRVPKPPATPSKNILASLKASGKKTVAKPAQGNHDTSKAITAFLLKEEKDSCFIPTDIPVTLEKSKNVENHPSTDTLLPVLSQIQTDSSNVQTTGKKTERGIQAIEKPLKAEAIPEYLEKPIWLVEKTKGAEIFSNRLRIITTHAVDNIPRKYLRFPRANQKRGKTFQTAGQISGIIYHASESDIFPFNPEMNASIKKHSADLIQYLKRNKSYHYFIDRFGRVYRIVRDEQAAFHAGRSIWADEESYYLNLNHAFIGICFEGKDFETIEPDASTSKTLKSGPRIAPMANTSINDAQLRSGKELTDWLRFKYRIRQHNCVPHGLVSINLKRKLIGHHLDLSHGFPFQRFGLEDKYQNIMPSIVDFGFTFDRFFLQIFKGKPWPGVNNSMAVLKQQAKEKKIDLAVYQKSLQKKFDSYYALEEDLQTRDENSRELLGKTTLSKTDRKK